MEAVMVNLADLPWRPMDDVPKDGFVIGYFGRDWNDIGGPLVNLRTPEDSDKYADGWLTLAEFDKLVNGEDAGI